MKGFRKLGEPLFSQGLTARLGLGTRMTAGGVPPAPDAPTGLTATPVSTSQINLAWTDNAINETAYRVYRSTNGVDYSQVGTDLAADTQAYSDTTVTAGTNYYYKVAAVNAGGETLSAAVQTNTILFGLKSYWKLGEAAGANRLDSIGTNHLTPSATSPTQEVGKIGNGAGFVAADSKNLTATLANVPSGAQAHTWALWVYPTSVAAGTRTILNMGASRAGAVVDFFMYQAGTSLLYRLEGAGTPKEVNFVNAFPSANQWYFIIAYWAGGANDIFVNVNNGTPASVALAGMVPDADAFTFALGSSVDLDTYWSGRMDELGVWNRVVTALEQTALYNSGNGWQPPF